MVRDLFSENVHLTDVALLNRLVGEKLEAVADELKAEGWAWVEIMHEFPYGQWRQLCITPRRMTGSEQAEHDRLSEELEALDDPETEECTDEARAAAIEARLTEIDDTLCEFTTEQKAACGAVVYLDYDGSIESRRGLYTEGQKVPGTEAPAEQPKEKPELSDALVEELTAHRTMAMRAVMAKAEDPHIALDALLHSLTLMAFYGRYWPEVVKIKAETTFTRCTAEVITTSPAAQELERIRQHWADQLPDQPEDLWQLLSEAAVPTKLELLSYLVATSLDAVHGARREAHPFSHTLANALQLDMADWWQPTAESFLKRVSADRIIDALAEAGKGPQALASFRNMKKAKLVSDAEKALDGTRWLPKPLRLPEPEPANDTGEAEAA